MSAVLLMLVTVLFQATTAIPQSAQTAAPSQSQNQNTFGSLPPDKRAIVLKLANLEKNFGKGMNSPGVELSMKEINRTRAEDRTLVHYDLYAKGLPHKAVYTIYKVQINGSILKNLDGVTLDEGGRAICAGTPGTCSGNGPNDPIDLMVYGGKGEPKRFALMSDDEAHLKGFVEVVPFPNDATDKGCTIESCGFTKIDKELAALDTVAIGISTDKVEDQQKFTEKEKLTTPLFADPEKNAAILIATLPA